jgi:hypothetical protein
MQILKVVLTHIRVKVIHILLILKVNGKQIIRVKEAIQQHTKVILSIRVMVIITHIKLIKVSIKLIEASIKLIKVIILVIINITLIMVIVCVIIKLVVIKQ